MLPTLLLSTLLFCPRSLSQALRV